MKHFATVQHVPPADVFDLTQPWHILTHAITRGSFRPHTPLSAAYHNTISSSFVSFIILFLIRSAFAFLVIFSDQK